MPGLRIKGQIWQIEKRCKHAEGGWLRESTGFSEAQRAEAEAYLIRRLYELEQAANRLVEGVHTFHDGAMRHLEEIAYKSSATDIAHHLDQLLPFVGELELEAVHDGTLELFIAHELKRGLRPKSINNALKVVSAVLQRAARQWRDEKGRPWLKQAPPRLTQVPNRGRQQQAYSLSWDEQDALFAQLPKHLLAMAMFKVNSGCREQEVCNLRWEWEVPVPELGTSVFIIPAFVDLETNESQQMVKNGEDRLVVLNSVAREVIEQQQGVHEEFVFTYAGRRVTKMNNSGWKSAWKRAGLPSEARFRKGVHNLKHTLGRRLRAVQCPMETRKALLGHTNGDITTHYSAYEIQELIDWLEKAANRNIAQTPTLTTLKRRELYVVGNMSEK
jgi:integrase